MSSGQPPTGPSAAKLGGFALLGVGALAIVLGVATTFSGGSDNIAQESQSPAPPTSVELPPPGTPESAKPPAESQPVAPPPPSPSATRSPSSPPPAGGSGPPPPDAEQSPERPGRESPAPGVPGQPVPEQPRPGDGQAGRAPQGKGTVERIELRVYNNSKIRGLAHRAADDFRRAGYTVTEIGNYSDGRIPATTLYYRPGTPERAQAETVAERFGARIKPRFDGIKDASPGVIAIITKDYDGPSQ